MNEVRVRVWREQWGQWWGELWVPRDEKDPPELDVFFSDPSRPGPIRGYKCNGLVLRTSKRSARRAAMRMADRHKAGLHPEHDKPAVEEFVV